MGYIYLYIGTGGGKTTNALGLALRTIGHNKKAIIFQFCKWRKDIGEYLIKDKLAGCYEIYQFGRKAWLGKEEKTVEFGGDKFKIEAITNGDKLQAQKGLHLAEQLMTQKRPCLLVLDEVTLAAYLGLLDVNEVLCLLDKIPKETTVVMTGRFSPQELIDRADFVNIVQDVKMPKFFQITEGIQY